MTTSTTSENKILFLIKKVSIAVIWFTIWQLCYLAVGEDLLLVSPLMTLKRLWELFFEGSFWLIVLNSCFHILSGFVLGVLFGVLLAALSARFSLFRELVSPIITIMKATPVASFIILALIWITSKNLSIFISFLLIMPLVYTNTLQGLRDTDKALLEAAQVYRLSVPKKLRYVYIPQALPHFFSACITGVGFAWKSGIAAEILAIPKNSIGTMLYESKIYLETTDLFAWTAVVILLSLFFEKVLVRFIRLGSEKLLHSRLERQGME